MICRRLPTKGVVLTLTEVVWSTMLDSHSVNLPDEFNRKYHRDVFNVPRQKRNKTMVSTQSTY